jgi:exonuclease III
MASSIDVPTINLASFNCRGFNKTKEKYISFLLNKCTFLFLQEHWLSELQLGSLGSIQSGVLYTGVSGFDNLEVLKGRPFGGCAILWHSNLLADVSVVQTNCKRICAVRVISSSWKLLLINVYMPYEDDEINSDEFVYVLSVVEEIIGNNSDCHVVVGGDFNVDFNRNWSHTELLSSFCDSNELLPTIRHMHCNVDYTYNFSMERFSILDHFILSGILYNTCVDGIYVLHDVDNISDHDPLF